MAKKVIVLTVSDTRTEADDVSGGKLRKNMDAAGFVVARSAIVRDDVDAIREAVRSGAGEADCVVLTGGTGLGVRDITPEAVEALFDKRIDGFGESFRRLSWDQVGPKAMLSRATAGMIGKCVVFALPGSSKAVDLGCELIIGIVDHACDLASGKHGHHG